MTIEPHPLTRDPLAFLAFEKIRRAGADRADGQTIAHEGIEHALTAHTISTIKTVHVVLETLGGLAIGHQRAMAIIEIFENGYSDGPGGLDLVLPAMYGGIHVPGPPCGACDYRVLPYLPVPCAFVATGHGR